MMYRVAYRFTGSKADAEDIAQDVCVNLARKLDSFHSQSQFSTWLYKVVVNACRDAVKRKSLHATLERTYLEMEDAKSAEEAAKRKASAWLWRQVAALDAPLKETALLVLAEGLSHADAADVLDCAESTVSWRMHEMKKQLKAKKEAGDE